VYNFDWVISKKIVFMQPKRESVVFRIFMWPIHFMDIPVDNHVKFRRLGVVMIWFWSSLAIVGLSDLADRLERLQHRQKDRFMESIVEKKNFKNSNDDAWLKEIFKK
jgi:hypothetical protein